MPTISPADLLKLRAEDQRAQIFATFARPDTLWSAVITGAPNRGDTSITFNTGAGANFGLIQAEMEVWVGTTSSDDNIGRFRIRSIASGDGGVTGTLVVALNTLFFSAGDHLTFKLDFPFKPKYSRITGTGASPTFYKDTNILYTDENTHLHPIIIAGSNRSGFINSTWVINPHLESSYTLDGATITSYSAASLSLDGTPTISIAAGTGIGTITFTTPGQYWIKYTVVSDNGKTQNSYRYYYAHSTDPTAIHYPHVDFSASTIVGAWTKGGWAASITVNANGTLSDIPEKTIAILWQVSYYQGVKENITFLPDSSNVLISGYVRKEKVTQDLNIDVGEVGFNIVTIEQIIRNHYGFSLALEAKQGVPDDWFKFASTLTIPKALHHLWKWQSNLLEIADVFLQGDNTLRPFVEMEAGDLYTLADNIAYKNGIRYHVICDKSGRLHLTPDIQLLRDNERAVLNTVQTIQAIDKSGKLVITRNPVDKAILTKVSGFAWDGTFSTTCAQPLTSPCPNVQPICAAAPTINPSDEGASVLSFDRQTFEDQVHANEIAGRYYGQANNLYPEIRINFSGNYAGVLDIVYDEFWDISVSIADTEREFVWANKNLICRSVTIQINQAKGTVLAAAVFEPEAAAIAGVATTCLGDFTFTFDLPAFPDFEFPDLTTPGALITGSDTNSVYYKGASGGGWTLRTSEETLDLIQDPFWSVKTGSFEPGNSIVWRCGVGFIKYSPDAAVTWVDVTPGTNPPNDAGDSTAPLVADVEFFAIDASWTTQDGFTVGARWQNSSSVWRSWLLVTTDNGANWTWQSIFGGGAGSGVENQLPGDAYGPDRPLGTQYGAFRYVTSLNGGSSIVVAYKDAADGNLLKAIVGNLAMDVVTWGTAQTVHTHTGGTGVESFTIAAQSDTSFLIAYKLGITDTNQYDGILRLGNVSGNSITSMSAADTFLNYSLGGFVEWHGLTIKRISDIKSIMTLLPDSINTAFAIQTGFHATIINIITGIPSIVGLNTYLMDRQFYALDVAVVSSTTIVLAMSAFVGLTSPNPSIHAGAMGLLGDTLTMGGTYVLAAYVGAPDTVLLRNVTVAPHNSSSATIIYNEILGTPNTNSTYAQAVTITALTLSYGLRDLLFTVTASSEEPLSFQLEQIGLHKVLFNYAMSDLTTSNVRDHTLVLDSLNSYATLENYVSTTNTSNTGIISACPLTPNTYFRVFQLSDLPGNEAAGQALGGFGIGGKLLGITNGKGAGLIAYATILTLTNNLAIFSYDLATLTLQNTYELGAATAAQVNAFTYIAYPYGKFGDDNKVVVFGNMQGIGHVISSVDGAASFSTVITDWGSDFCGSYFDNGYTTAAIRCDGTNSKIYAGDGLTLRSTIPLPRVMPHAMKADFAGTLFIGSGVAQSIMLISTTQNYYTYYDLTADHGITKVINGLEIL